MNTFCYIETQTQNTKHINQIQVTKANKREKNDKSVPRAVVV